MEENDSVILPKLVITPDLRLYGELAIVNITSQANQGH